MRKDFRAFSRHLRTRPWYCWLCCCPERALFRCCCGCFTAMLIFVGAVFVLFPIAFFYTLLDSPPRTSADHVVRQLAPALNKWLSYAGIMRVLVPLTVVCVCVAVCCCGGRRSGEEDDDEDDEERRHED